MANIPTHLNIMFSPTYAVPVFGYIVPPLAGIVFVVNGLMMWILSRPNMRSPANALLICIAISDTLAILFPVVPFIYFYTLGYYIDFVPFAWCRVFFTCVHVFPLLTNMASLWSTVALATMRFYSVWRPLQAKVSITNFRTYMIILAIYIMSAITYTPLFFEYTYHPISTESLLAHNTTIVTCHMQKSVIHEMETFCVVHTWIQIIFTSLLPWFLITFPDAGLLWKLRKAESDRKYLQDGIKSVENGGADGSLMDRHTCGNRNMSMAGRKRMTTLMIFIIVSMVWMVEIPYAVSFTKYLSHNNGDVMRNSLGSSVVFVLLLKYITYPLIFLLYCFMSQRFRVTFLEKFACRRKDHDNGQSMTSGSREKNRSTDDSATTQILRNTSSTFKEHNRFPI